MKYLDLKNATGDENARWQNFQINYLNNENLLCIDNKSRQVGWSWTSAAGAVADAIIIPRSIYIFVSINQEEAREKIRYAKYIIDSLNDKVKPKLIIDNQTELEFDNGSRLISHPCRPVRGKAKATVILDEFAHYPKDREIYTSAVPVITRGGKLIIGSSPLGATGLFWEIFEQKIQPYPGYARRKIPWWEVDGLCNDIDMAMTMAPSLETDQRVKMFGTSRLINIYENMVFSDFIQEYELSWVDESVSWITWDEIKRNQIDAQEEKLWYRQARNLDDAFAAIEDVAIAMRENKIENAFMGGVDVGRTRNLTEIVLLGKSNTQIFPYRLGISLDNVEFDDQQSVIMKILDELPITKILIDRNGLGMQLAEDLQKHSGGIIEGANFTNTNKELWSNEIKLKMQRGQLPIPLDRELSYQIHSIRKKITASKNVQYDTDANEKHHADKYWALALALWAAGQSVDVAVSITETDNNIYHAERPKSAWQ